MLRRTVQQRCAAAATAAAASATGASKPRSYRGPQNMTLKDPDCAAALKRVVPVVYSALPNGVRIATEYVKDTNFSTIGVWIDAGSRFETIENNGVAHFLEHMNFKGTERYSKQAIEDTFEYLGAHFNAYTSRDRTAYYAKVFNKDVEEVFALMADVLKNGTYTSRDVELERPTILAEMREVEELVDEVLMDNVHQAAYDGTNCGLPLTILGPVDNISTRIDREMIKEYVRTHYTGPRMSIIASGGISPDRAHQLAATYFGDLPSHSNRPKLQAQYRGGYTVMWNEMMATANTAVCFPICGASHPDSYALQVVHNVIGQLRDMNVDQFGWQRFNPMLPWTQVPNLIQLRPFYTPYEETSLLGYQIVTARMSPSNDKRDVVTPYTADQAQTVMLNYVLELMYSLCDKLVDEKVLDAAKCEYKASVMMMRDSTTNSAEDLGRQMIHFGRRVPIEEVYEHVDSVTPTTFRDVVHKYIASTLPTVSCIGAASALPTFDPRENLSLRLHPQLTANMTVLKPQYPSDEEIEAAAAAALEAVKAGAQAAAAQ